MGNLANPRRCLEVIPAAIQVSYSSCEPSSESSSGVSPDSGSSDGSPPDPSGSSCWPNSSETASVSPPLSGLSAEPFPFPSIGSEPAEEVFPSSSSFRTRAIPTTTSGRVMFTIRTPMAVLPMVATSESLNFSVFPCDVMQTRSSEEPTDSTPTTSPVFSVTL